MTEIHVTRKICDGDYIVAEGIYSKEQVSRILDRLSKKKQKELMRVSEEVS